MMIRYFTCQCKWSYVIGKKTVIGPFFEDGQDDVRAIDREQWEYEYADCAHYWRKDVLGYGGPAYSGKKRKHK